MVGLVLVSHSSALADGTALLAREMGGADVAIATAGGLDGEGGIGTDATRVLAAIDEVWSEEGVLVLMDLGSALLSAEMALDLFDVDRRGSVLLSDAPFVEGAVAAAVAAKLGRSLKEVELEARGGLAGKAAHLGSEMPRDDVATEPVPQGPEARVTLDVDLPHGLHARPAARLVQTASAFDADVRVTNLSAGRGPVSAGSLNAVATLGVTQGQRIEVVARGPQATLVADAMQALAERRFDEELEEPMPAPAPPAGERTPVAGALRGVAASPGAVVGPARLLQVPDLAIPEGQATSGGSPAEERARLEHALAAVRADVARQRDEARTAVGEAQAAIFDAHRLFLQDEALLTPSRAGIDAGASAAASWSAAVEELAAAWERLEDPYLRERADDLRSVGRQVLARILDVELPRPRLDAPGILVARDLEPGVAAGLDPAVCRGIAIAGGGPTSHAAILARALGIPAVVGLGDALLAVRDGVPLGLDGVAGAVYVDPPASTIAELEATAEEITRRQDAARARAASPARTSDGVGIDVLANVGGAVGIAIDVRAAVAAGCDGVGLLRSEFLFVGRAAIPDEDEQERVYRAAAEALGDRPLTIRTLDVGADKPLAGISRPDEANPFLGVRGIRLGLERPELLATQLRAIVRVAADHDVRVLFPMIATVDELDSALAMLDGAASAVARPPVGIMIEVPSAALLAGRLAREVAFLSIGTNDLTQYVLAADRGNEHVQAIADPLHPAVLRLIREAAAAAADAGIPAAVCGELAGDPSATALLLGLGVRELSMSAPSIPAVKDAVRRTKLQDATALASAAIAASSAAEVRELLEPGAGLVGTLVQ